MSVAAALLDFVRPQSRRVLASATLTALTTACGVGLMGTSAWLVARAAQRPSIAALQVAIVGVRAFGIGRATLRYLERLVSHDATLRLLEGARVALFRRLVPLAPARLVDARAGDVLGRAVADVATLEGFPVRVLGPSLAAAATAVLVAALLLPFGSCARDRRRRRSRPRRGRRSGPRDAAGGRGRKAAWSRSEARSRPRSRTR